MARLAYLGTPDMAVPPLRALAGAGHDIALCVTRPDRRRGRGGQMTPSPVKEAATELGIAVTHDMDDVAAAAAVELAVVVAYGRIIPSRLLDLVPTVNLHFSLLPRWRGAAPVERAILAGDDETGVCVMKVEAGLDTGPVYAVRTVPLDDEALDALREQLVAVGSDLLVDTLAGGVSGLPEPVPQHGEVTIADKITKEDLHLDWAEPAVQLKRVVRLGRAWTTFRGKRLTVLQAAVGDAEPGAAEHAPGSLLGPAVVTGAGTLVLQRVQPESRSPMSADEWLRGVRPTDGERLGTD